MVFLSEGSYVFFTARYLIIVDLSYFTQVIWQKSDQAGQPFWGVGPFCGLAKTTPKRDCNLTALEWDGNDIYSKIFLSTIYFKFDGFIIHALSFAPCLYRIISCFIISDRDS